MVEKMDWYQRVENEIRIISHGRMRNYITYAMSLLHVFLSVSLCLCLSLFYFFYFLHGSVIFCFVWLCYNLLELCRLFCCMEFSFFWLWIACKRVWLGFWWRACVLWSQKFGKIADNYFSIIDVRLLKQKKERKSYSRKLKCNTSFNLFENMCPWYICMYLCVFFFNFFCVYIANIFWVLILNHTWILLIVANQTNQRSHVIP